MSIPAKFKHLLQPLDLGFIQLRMGAGSAGLSFAIVAAERGHHITIFEASSQIGGQLTLAKQVPGKEEFQETLNYYQSQLKRLGVEINLNTACVAETFIEKSFDHVILATGIRPRLPDIPNIDHPKVVNYLDVIGGKKVIGKKVAIIGAGGIGFDVAEYLAHSGTKTSLDSNAFLREWGIDPTLNSRGGVQGIKPQIETSSRQIFLLQRKANKIGAGLGKTTGWIHRTNLIKKGIEFITSVQYQLIDDAGLHLMVDNQKRCLDVDNIVICAGQESQQDLLIPLEKAGMSVHLIGGADKAVELNAKRSIDQGARLAAKL